MIFISCTGYIVSNVNLEFWKYDENCRGLLEGRETNPRNCMGKLRKTKKSLVGIFNLIGQI